MKAKVAAEISAFDDRSARCKIALIGDFAGARMITHKIPKTIKKLSGLPLVGAAIDRSCEKYGDLWPQRLPAGSVVPDTEFEKHAPRSDWRICRGGSGTIVFAETVGFNKGGRATLRNRLFAHWTFTTPGSHWPRTSLFGSEVVNAFSSPAAKCAMTCGLAGGKVDQTV